MKKINWTYLTESTLHSYSQIFFSQHKVFAVAVMVVTLFAPRVGLTGLAAVLCCNMAATLLGFNRLQIREGLWGFNALLMGLWMGYTYSLNTTFLLLFPVVMAMLLLITAALKGLTGKHNLPVLSIPFILTYFLVAKATSQVTFLQIDELHAYSLNEIALQQHSLWYQFAHCLDGAAMPKMLHVFFRTLSGTFFIDSVLGGMLIAAALLLSSRIAFTLGVMGFGGAWCCYQLFGVDVNALTYHLVGSNYILMSICIGCFFLVPNAWSYLTTLLLTPVLMLLLIPLGKINGELHLQSFTFSFSLLTVLFLFTLNQRKTQPFLHLALVQYYNAEKAVYKYLSSLQRFRNAHLAKVALPFWGEWKVSQGYEGKITHLGDWSKALDFVITDGEGKTYSEPGLHREDFFCYDKPVLAPLDGYVYDIVNHVEENDISGVNTGQNWGNTIILNHLNGLYSQISHIRKDSFKVSIGDYVTKGTALATCGNSGRSPEPHIHFQMQASPVVGSRTLDYPPACFIEHGEGTQKLHVAEVPREGMIISNVEVAMLLKECFTFNPGKKISFLKQGENSLTEWEVLTDAWNRSYIYCSASRSYAYFENDGAMFRFTDFEGSHKSLLFYFYLGQYRHLLGCYPSIVVSDDVPLIHRSSRWLQWLQDFVAPFYLFTKADFHSQVRKMDNPHNPSEVTLHSEVSARAFGQKFGQLSFETRLKDGKISEFTIQHPNSKEVYQCA